MFYLNSVHARILNSGKILYTIFWRQQATFYDVLNLKKDCSGKDIKDSYIKLSKLYHPDVTNNSKSAHQKFVKISEAYNTLSKPDLRRNYDWVLENPRPVETSKHHHDYYEDGMYENPIFKRYRSKTGYRKDPDDYYGIKGIKKQPHSVIVGLCVGLAIITLVIQVALGMKSSATRREQIKRNNEENELILQKVRAESELNGRELQIELLRRRVEENEIERKKRFK